jgi:NADH dehydrogenase/NADH:ubiquinone oxidoreductase subunit G
MKIPIIIDGIRIETNKGNPIIRAIKKAGINVPTLCHHESLKPYGSCRLCTVEVTQKKQTKLVTSCTYQVESDMEVLTDTSKLRQIRRMIIRLLLARSPESDVIRGIAKKLGIKEPGFEIKGTNNCILCGLCVRFCEEVVCVSAIGLSNRGTEREVATPFKTASETCIGCGSCTYICPTGCIEMVSEGKGTGKKVMKMGDISLEPCPDGYKCDNCDIDRQFIEKTKSEIACFRKKFYTTSDITPGKAKG